VHPAKADVRFRDPGLVRGLIVGTIRHALAQSGIRPATSGAEAMLKAFQAQGYESKDLNASQFDMPQRSSGSFTSSPARNWQSASNYRPDAPRQEWSPQTAHPAQRPLHLDNQPAPRYEQAGFGEAMQATISQFTAPSADSRAAEIEAPVELLRAPLGAARAQIHANYIVAQTEDSLVIVDQHAAHERLVYEALKTALEAKPMAAQMLLIPEIVDLPEEDAERVVSHAETLERFGLSVERFGPGAVAVRETPSMLGEMDVQQLIRDLADEIAEHDTANGLKDMLNHVAATMACHGSVRSGRRMKGEEMNALLRQMEATPGSGTCNHGRPTYIELKLSDIERLFGRR
jgi:DNA mismatch repair protein MutL